MDRNPVSYHGKREFNRFGWFLPGFVLVLTEVGNFGQNFDYIDENSILDLDGIYSYPGEILNPSPK